MFPYIRAMNLPAVFKAAADFCKAVDNPDVEMAKLFILLLSLLDYNNY